VDTAGAVCRASSAKAGSAASAGQAAAAERAAAAKAKARSKPSSDVAPTSRARRVAQRGGSVTRCVRTRIEAAKSSSEAACRPKHQASPKGAVKAMVRQSTQSQRMMLKGARLYLLSTLPSTALTEGGSHAPAAPPPAAAATPESSEEEAARNSASSPAQRSGQTMAIEACRTIAPVSS